MPSGRGWSPCTLTPSRSDHRTPPFRDQLHTVETDDSKGQGRAGECSAADVDSFIVILRSSSVDTSTVEEGVDISTAGDEDLCLWLSWKRVNEVIRGQILADLVSQSSLTEAEFTVLAYLDDAGGSIRQNALATAAGWDRTRLSHLLKRMEDRGHLARTKLRNGVEVSLLPAGRTAFDSLHEPLTRAVRDHFTSRLGPEQRAAVHSLTEALNRPT